MKNSKLKNPKLKNSKSLTRMKKLKTQLREFGLNPRDWKLVFVGPQSGGLIRKDDKGVCLRGTICTNQDSVSWKTLQMGESLKS